MALVVTFAPAGECYFNLGEAVLEIHGERDQRQARFLGLISYPTNFFAS